MPGPIDLSCRCGAVAVRVAEGPGMRCTCYCADCRGYAHRLGRGEILDPAGGTEVYHTTPDLVSITRGADRIACLRMTQRGPLRWFAACCNTPLAGTPPTRAVPFVGIVLAGAADPEAAGRCRARLFPDAATAPLTGRPRARRGNVAAVVGGVVARGIAARLAGRHRDTPFFDAAGAPVAQPEPPA
ncbi:hypothetical protein EKE94_07560 [Mesobaculum littorinae]|uniref:CENP-V/GFA domain-containing protein n=1 Tax=Mesobaculum littorinae TaxID=2486419 RepID=A0A438AJ65_9RHOB|nr:DUF6151 family protein [Mesobaculum littorinae]RVV98750.1 hypothetical protein EKE94_07560 [Mesobaculum littorinae]